MPGNDSSKPSPPSSICQISPSNNLSFLPQERLLNLTNEEFKHQAEVLANRKMEKDKKLEEETDRYWAEINSHHYQFDRSKKKNSLCCYLFFSSISLPVLMPVINYSLSSVNQEVEALKSVTIQELLDFFDSHFNKKSRAKLSLHQVSQSHKEQQEKELNSMIRNTTAIPSHDKSSGQVITITYSNHHQNDTTTTTTKNNNTSPASSNNTEDSNNNYSHRLVQDLVLIKDINKFKRTMSLYPFNY